MEQNILVGTEDGLRQLGGDGGVHMAGHQVSALTRDDSGWWAIADGREVWRREADGEWIRAASVENLRANCLLPVVGGVFIGTSDAHLFLVQGGTVKLVVAFDEVEGRDSWFTPWGGPPDVRSISAAASGAFYANVHVGGVVRSGDGGSSWEPTLDIHADVHQVMLHLTSGLVLAASARGLAVSDDDGGSWRFDTEGLHGSYQRAVAVAGGTVLVSASTGPSTSQAAVYRKPLGNDGPFDRCQTGLPEWFPSNIDTFCLAASESTAAFGTHEGSVFVSSDEGESWTTVAEGLPPVQCVALE